jgi:hypothetical protein
MQESGGALGRSRAWRGAALARTPLTKRYLLYDVLGRNGVRNRRLPGMTQRLAAPLAYRTETLGQSIALGNSREPPAFTFPSRNT